MSLRQWLKERDYDAEDCIVITIETTHYNTDKGDLLCVSVADPATDEINSYAITGIGSESIDKNSKYTGISSKHYTDMERKHAGALEDLLFKVLKNKKFVVGFALDAPAPSGQFTRTWMDLHFPGIFRPVETLDLTMLHKLLDKDRHISAVPQTITELTEYIALSHPKHTGYTYGKILPLYLPAVRDSALLYKNKIEDVFDLYKTILDRL